MSLPFAASSPLDGSSAFHGDVGRFGGEQRETMASPFAELGNLVQQLPDAEVGRVLDALGKHHEALQLVMEADRVGAVTLPDSLRAAICAVLVAVPAFAASTPIH